MFESEDVLSAPGVIVGALAVEALVAGIESVAEPIHRAEERAGLMPVAATAVFSERADPHGARIEKQEMLLLGKLLG